MEGRRLGSACGLEDCRRCQAVPVSPSVRSPWWRKEESEAHGEPFEGSGAGEAPDVPRDAEARDGRISSLSSPARPASSCSRLTPRVLDRPRSSETDLTGSGGRVGSVMSGRRGAAGGGPVGFSLYLSHGERAGQVRTSAPAGIKKTDAQARAEVRVVLEAL